MKNHMVEQIKGFDEGRKVAFKTEIIELLIKGAAALKEQQREMFSIHTMDIVDEIEGVVDYLKNDPSDDNLLTALFLLVKIHASTRIGEVSCLAEASFYEEWKAAGYIETLTANIRAPY